MADTFTSLLRLRKPEQGANTGTWGPLLNAGFTQLLDDSIASSVNVNVTVGNVTLSTANGTTDQARRAIIVATGTPGTTRTINVPATSKRYVFVNRCSDGSLVRFTTAAAASGFTLKQYAAALAFVDINAVPIDCRVIQERIFDVDRDDSVFGEATTALNTTFAIANRTAGASTASIRYIWQGSRVICKMATHTTTISDQYWFFDSSSFTSAFLPEREAQFDVCCLDGAVETPAVLVIPTSGSWRIDKRGSAVGGWTAPGARTLPLDFTFSWAFA